MIEDKHGTMQQELQKKNEADQKNQNDRLKQLAKTQEMLLDFKNTRMLKKKEIENEENRYKMLLATHGQVIKQGQEDLERQKQRINAQYAQFLEDFRKNALLKAEKNISEIERNIQAQNQRLEDEAQI